MKAGFIPAVSKCVPPNATRRRMQRRGFRGGGLPHPRLVDQTRWGCRPDLLRPSPSAYLQTPPDGACNGGGSAGEACLTRALWTRRGGDVGRIYSGRLQVRTSKRHQTAHATEGAPRGRPASPAFCNGGGSAGEACLTRALKREAPPRRRLTAVVSRLSRLPAAAWTRPEPPVARIPSCGRTPNGPSAARQPRTR